MDPFSSVSTSILTAKAAGNLFSGLASTMMPAAASFREAFSQIFAQGDQPGEEIGVDDAGQTELQRNQSIAQLAAHLQERLAELLAEAGFSTQLGFQVELTPLGSVYVNPDHSSRSPASLDQQLEIERILEGDGKFKRGLQQWMSVSGMQRFPYLVDE